MFNINYFIDEEMEYGSEESDSTSRRIRGTCFRQAQDHSVIQHIYVHSVRLRVEIYVITFRRIFCLFLK